MLVSNPEEAQKQQQQQHQEQEEMLIDVECDDEDEQQQQQQPQQRNRTISNSQNSAILSSVAKFTLIDSNGEIFGNATARQPMLLTNAASTTPSGGGIRIVPQPGLNTKTISIPLNGKQIPIVAAMSYPLTQTQQALNNASNNSGGGVGAGSIVPRHKQFTPLTPPPTSSRKFVEPLQSRIRSHSMSSHKFSAHHHHHHHQHHHGGNSSSSSSNGGGNSMMVDDIPPTQQHPSGFALTSNSPPRQGGGGSHYMHMMTGALGSQQAGSAGANGHVTPRRRTISSTSNG